MAVRKKYGKRKQPSLSWAPPSKQPTLPRVKDVQVKAEPGQTLLKRLGRDNPRTFLSDPTALLKHAKRFAPSPPLAADLVHLIKRNVREFDRLVARRLKTASTGNRGTPKKDEIMVLTSGLLVAYYRCSGKEPTRHYKKDRKMSAAGRFIEAIFTDLGLNDPDSWIKKHNAEKEKLNCRSDDPTPGVPPVLF